MQSAYTPLWVNGHFYPQQNQSSSDKTSKPCQEPVLHTWGQTLHHHPHIHCLVPAGGLALDGTAWVSCPKRFFLPVRVLSRFFRRTFLTALRQAAIQERLNMQGQCQRWASPRAWHQLLTTV